MSDDMVAGEVVAGRTVVEAYMLAQSKVAAAADYLHAVDDLPATLPARHAKALAALREAAAIMDEVVDEAGVEEARQGDAQHAVVDAIARVEALPADASPEAVGGVASHAEYAARQVENVLFAAQANGLRAAGVRVEVE